MRRERLGDLYGKRLRFYAQFEREGKKRTYRGWGSNGDGTDSTVLLKDIRLHDTGKLVSDHLWFNLTQAFDDLCLVEGEVVSFDARIDDYTKGYKRDDFDYKLSRPTKVVSHGRPDWTDYDGPSSYVAPVPEDEDEKIETSTAS